MKAVWLTFSLLCISLMLNAQERIIHGVVNVFDSIPLADAQVYVKSTKRMVFTDSNGRFAAPINAKDKLKISANGFLSRKIKIKPKVKMVAVNLQLKPNLNQDLYAIGYGYLFEENRSTATNRLARNEASFSRYSSIYDLVAGQFPGVEVKNGQIVIRGANTLNSGEGALLVLDGVIIEPDILRSLRPVQVKDINVLKDGAAAIYGSRGAGGVVLIETLKGGDVMK